MSTPITIRVVEQAETDAMFDAHNEAMAAAPTELPEGTLVDGLDDDPWPLDEHGRPAR